jgi:hypothetical protein
MDDGSLSLDERVVSLAQFERVAVDASGLVDWRELATSIESALGEASDRSKSDHLVARVSVSGATPLAWTVRRDADVLYTEAASRAEAIGNVWIEKLETDCRKPVIVDPADSGDPVEVLRRTITDEIVASEAFHAQAQIIVDNLLDQLPPECRRVLAPDETGLALLVGQLSDEGSEEVLARLTASGREGAS